MRIVMKVISWLVFLAFIGLSSFANWMHGETHHAKIMLAVVPVGFAAAVFLYEGMTAAGKAEWWQHVAVGAVALCSGVASYLGLFGMARDNGIPIVQAALLPLAYDGVVAVASMAIRSFTVSHVPDPAKGHVPAKVSRKRVPVAHNVPPVVSHVPVPRDTVRDTDVPMSLPDVPDAVPVSPRKGQVAWDKDKARRLLSEGRSRKDVAELVGVSRKSIDRLAAEGVEE